VKRNVALIGFMGTGKSLIGRLLARKLGMGFVETDELVVSKAGKPIPRIFKEDGEEEFRRIESLVVREVSRMRGFVISCGGGVVLNKNNVSLLKQSSVLVRLTAKPEVILQRVLNSKEERPLLEVEDKLRRIMELLAYREPFYAKAADYTVDTSNLTPEEVVEKILELLKSGGFRVEGCG